MNPSRGITLKIASTLAFTLMLALLKLLADTLPPGELVFGRSFFALVPIVAMLAWQRQIPGALRTSRPFLHLRRGTIGIVSMTLSFASLAFLPLPEAMAFGYASPLMIVVLAAFVLGETVRAFRWTAVAIGFFGIAVILWPEFTVLRSGNVGGGTLLGAMLALAAAVASSWTAIFIRSMTQTEATGTIVFYFSLNSAILALISLPFGWVMPGRGDAALLVLAGLLGGIGQIMMTASYRHADAATIAPFEYVSMIWGLIAGYVLFSEVPHASVIVGGSIVVGAGMIIIMRERQLGLQRARQRSLTPPG